jgi:hypothetical protein
MSGNQAAISRWNIFSCQKLSVSPPSWINVPMSKMEIHSILTEEVAWEQFIVFADHERFKNTAQVGFRETIYS